MSSTWFLEATLRRPDRKTRHLQRVVASSRPSATFANASGVGAVVGVAGATIGAFLGPAGAAAGEWAGVGTGAAVGTFLGGSVAGAATGGYEVGLAYPDQVSGFVDGFTSAAQEYQANPPPI